MEYRVVYDVLDDGLRWGAPTVLSGTLLIMAFLFFLSRRQGQARHAPPPAVASRFLILALVVGGLAFAAVQGRMFRSQQQCQQWASAGQYAVATGTVAEYERSRNVLRFRVAQTRFSCANRFGGYVGKFTAPGVPPDALRNGVGIRIAHREGFILRIEVAAEQAVADRPRE